jgi:hypothetical protein
MNIRYSEVSIHRIMSCRSSKLKTSLGANRVEELRTKHSLTLVVWQPQDVHAGVCSWQMLDIVISINAHLGLHSCKAQSWRSRAGSHIEEEERFLFACHLFEHLPEDEYSFIFLMVIIINSV